MTTTANVIVSVPHHKSQENLRTKIHNQKLMTKTTNKEDIGTILDSKNQKICQLGHY